MSARPNILFLTHRVPHPPNRGDRIRSWNMLRFLSKQANIHLACLADEPVSEESLFELNRLCERVEIQPISSKGRWFNALRAMLSGRSATEGLFQSNSLHATIRHWAQETKFDSVLVFCSSMFQFATCRELKDAQLVVDLVDVDSEKWSNYADTAPFWKQPLYRLEGTRVRQLEKAIAHRANAVTLVSEDEVKVFRTFCETDNVHAISNGVDLEYFHPAPAKSITKNEGISAPAPCKLVFVGVLNYHANIEGLKWFCQNVWPLVQKSIPGIELDLVGRHPGDAVRKLAQLPGVNLIGEVDDVRPSVWQADVVIAPLTIARGIQNKVLEAMAMGKPVIATPQAIEGTGAVAGEHLVAAATPGEWANALKELENNASRREHLAQAARDFIEIRASWSKRLSNLSNLLMPQSMLQAKEAREVSVTS